jgi:surface polysaccharide O-acyltransferase-like enzyme
LPSTGTRRSKYWGDVTVSIKKSRLNGMDSMRAIAAFAVLLIHFCPFPAPAYDIVQVLVRFAVPFFFISSGYFFGLGVERNGIKNQALHTCKKLSALYATWWIIYFIFPSSAEIRRLGFLGSYLSRFERVTLSIENFVFLGPTVHLWYFPSLICAVIVASILLIYVKNPVARWAFAGMTYAFGLLGGSYGVTKFGVSLPINHKHFVFFSLLPFYMGIVSAKTEKFKLMRRYGLLMFALGAAGHFVEARILLQNFGSGMQSHDYLIATLIMAYGAFMMSVSNATLLGNQVLGYFGKLAGGTYLIHILVLQRIPYLEPLLPPNVWMWLAPLFAYLLSALSAAAMLKLPFLKRAIPA